MEMFSEGAAVVGNVRLAQGTSQGLPPPDPHTLSFSPRIAPGISRYSIVIE